MFPRPQLDLPPDVHLLNVLATQCLHRLQDAAPEHYSSTLASFAKVRNMGAPGAAGAARASGGATSHARREARMCLRGVKRMPLALPAHPPSPARLTPTATIS